MLLMLLAVSLSTSFFINSLTSSNDLWSFPEKALFIFHQIFSAGFNSGEYDGIKRARQYFQGLSIFEIYEMHHYQAIEL